MIWVQGMASELQVTELPWTMVVILQVHCSLTQRVPTQHSFTCCDCCKAGKCGNSIEQHASTLLILPRTANECRDLAPSKMMQQL